MLTVADWPSSFSFWLTQSNREAERLHFANSFIVKAQNWLHIPQIGVIFMSCGSRGEVKASLLLFIVVNAVGAVRFSITALYLMTITSYLHALKEYGLLLVQFWI